MNAKGLLLDMAVTIPVTFVVAAILMHQLNAELDTTFIIVTHDQAVARQTSRILIMRDGQIVRVHQVGSPYEEDLKAFRDSGVGRAILAGDDPDVAYIDPQERDLLHQILQDVE